MQLAYSFDGPTLLGTGGALRQALPLLGEKFFVLYGDSYLTAPFAPIAEHFGTAGKAGLMTVYRNEGLYDRSNVVFRNGEIAVYNKGTPSSEMRHIDYGLSIFRESVFRERPQGRAFDLADVMMSLIEKGELAGFEVPERFYEIGSPAGLAELEKRLQSAGKSKHD
jgi:NDP-sugar pyrophosphorylase family protein